MIRLVGQTNLNCTTSLSNIKKWKIFSVNELTGQVQYEVTLKNNPTINYAELVLQPKTLSYGLYKLEYDVIMEIDSTLTSLDFTYLKIAHSGLALSTLKLSQPMYGGTIQITRGQNQIIQFDPFLFTYDIDGIAVITSLSFKYACQIIDSNQPQGYPKFSGLNETIDLLNLKANASLIQYLTCFNSTGILV
jgi:hypothetical protein